MVQQDLIIITGVGNEASSSASNEHEVQFAIVKVLRDELGLDVITGYGRGDHTAGIQKIEASNDFKNLARRPQDLGVLKVTGKSLRSWLQKREGS